MPPRVSTPNNNNTSIARAGRSVLDYKTSEEILQALSQLNLQNNESAEQQQQPQQQQSDWQLGDYPQYADHYAPQLLEKEAQRLEVLRDYLILDTDQGEASFDKLTTEAGERFNVPWAVVSFVDMGRVWFKSWHKRDFDTSETSRTDFFCAHAIQQQQQQEENDHVFVSLDTTQDIRFASTKPLNEQGQRFYAGVPLVVPEGVRIGTFCLMDSKPRPNGLSQQEKQDLQKFAAQTVQLLVERKNELLTAKASSNNTSNTIEHATKSLNSNSSHKKGPVSPRIPSIKHPSKQENTMSQKKTRKGSFTRSTLSSSFSGELAPSAPPQEIIPRPEVTTAAPPQNIIQRPVASVLLPNPNTDGVDPDTYLSQLLEAIYGVKLNFRTGLELGNYFTSITDEQMGAYTMEVVNLARNNDTEGLRQVLEEQGREALDCFNRFGEGLLNLSCRRGYTSTVKFLLSEEVGLNVRIRDDFGRTPLHDCCWNPEPLFEICECLMKRDPSLFFITDKRGYTPFQYARSTDWLQWRQFLLEHKHLLAPLVSPEIKSRFS